MRRLITYRVLVLLIFMALSFILIYIGMCQGSNPAQIAFRSKNGWKYIHVKQGHTYYIFPNKGLKSKVGEYRAGDCSIVRMHR